MDLRLHFLEARQNFLPWKQDLQQQAEKVRLQIEKIVPTHLHNIAVDILICNDPDLIIPEIAMGGSCYKSELVSMSIETENPDFLANLKTGYFAQTLAHELHHAMRWNSCGYGQTLGEAIISEGLADYFSTLITGLPIPQWSQVDISKDLLQKAKSEIFDDNYNHYAWFFGAGDLPRWAGYSIGYKLVEAYYHKNPSIKKNGMIDVKADEILGMWQYLQKSA